MDRRLAAALVSLGVLAHAAPAAPQTAIDVRTWRPSTDPEAGLVLEPSGVPCAGCFNFSTWFSYAHDPVAVHDGSSAAFRPVAHQVDADAVAGVGLGARSAVGIDLPFVLWQNGSSVLPSTDKASTAALGDLSLTGKVVVVSNSKQGVPIGFGLSALGAVSFPTGGRSSYAGDGAATVSIRALGEYALGLAAVRASLGFVFRPDGRAWTPDVVGEPVSVGNSVPWALSLVLRPKAVVPALDRDDRQQWEIGADGSLPAGPVAPFGLGGAGASTLSPALVSIDDRVSLGRTRDAFMLVGVQAGLDGAVGVPAFRATLSFGWAPRKHDRDDDGVPDDVDQCPDLPEDRDGIQDDDGCPEDDADSDGILDEQDACPLVAGAPSSDPRKNGCPPGAAPAAKGHP